jgi:hypothetical protein
MKATMDRITRPRRSLTGPGAGLLPAHSAAGPGLTL